MKYSLSGTLGMTWPEILSAVTAAEEAGFEAFYASDHLGGGMKEWAGADGSLDALSLLNALASRTHRIRLGTLVSPVTVRSALDLVRSMIALDHISGGRAEIGLGIGALADEHDRFGYNFGSHAERVQLLAETCEVVRLLWESSAPVCYEGASVTLTDAVLRPRPDQQFAPILIGGSSTSIMRTAVRWARKWNLLGTPESVRAAIHRFRRLEQASLPSALPLEISVMMSVRVVPLGEAPPLDLETTPTPPHSIIADGNLIAEYVAAYGDAGVDGIIFVQPPDRMTPSEITALARSLPRNLSGNNAHLK